MTNLIVRGGRPLRGEITPSANKNAVLPVLCATLLSDAPLVLHRVPDITDVRKILEFFQALGSQVDMDYATGTLRLHHGENLRAEGAHLPLGMRSSVMLIPALLHRFGQASLEEPAHMEVFEAFGARVETREGAILISTPEGFHATRHWLDYASVTTTENFAICAATAKGTSQLVNAACEPHVQEFCRFLIQMGASVQGVGASTLTIEGVERWGPPPSPSRTTSTRWPPSWPWARSPAATWRCATAPRNPSR